MLRGETESQDHQHRTQDCRSPIGAATTDHSDPEHRDREEQKRQPRRVGLPSQQRQEREDHRCRDPHPKAPAPHLRPGRRTGDSDERGVEAEERSAEDEPELDRAQESSRPMRTHRPEPQQKRPDEQGEAARERARSQASPPRRTQPQRDERRDEEDRIHRAQGAASHEPGSDERAEQQEERRKEEREVARVAPLGPRRKLQVAQDGEGLGLGRLRGRPELAARRDLGDQVRLHLLAVRGGELGRHSPPYRRLVSVEPRTGLGAERRQVHDLFYLEF